MLKIKESYNCFDVGVRGLCEDADLYLDDLAGINIANLASISGGLDFSPKDTLARIERQSFRQLSRDFKILLSKKYTLNSVLEDESIKLSGSYQWYGEVDEFVSIKVIGYSNDKFVERKIFGFGIVSDRAVEGKKFYLETDRHEKQEIIVNLKKGYNKIDVDVTTDAEFVRISFDVSNFMFGRREDYGNGTCGCMVNTSCGCDYSKCSHVICETSPDGCDWTETSVLFGFDLCVQCRCSLDKLVCYFSEDLEMAYLYKMGINFLLEAKASTDISVFTRNSEMAIEDLLLRWQGGVDMATSIKHKSEYWRSLGGAVDSIKGSIKELNTKCLKCDSSYLKNDLP